MSFIALTDSYADVDMYTRMYVCLCGYIRMYAYVGVYLNTRDFKETAWGEEVHQRVGDGWGCLDSAHRRAPVVTLKHAHHHGVLGVAGPILVHLCVYRDKITSRPYMQGESPNTGDSPKGPPLCIKFPSNED